jgi:predicted ATPase
MNGEAYAIRNRTESRANLLRAKNHNAYRIVLTGGPCAGKSSAAAELQEQLTSHGFLVFTLPEIATVMFNAGANWTQFAETEEGLAAFQSELTKLQIAQEDSFLRLCGVTEKPCVVICDRGLMDGKAYCTPKVWDIVQKKLWMNESRMLARYDAVAFMVTAADGAEEFYTKDNNAARRENPEEAVKVDRKLKDCWQQHRNLAVFDNTCTTFQSKVQSVVQFVLNQVAAANQPRKFYIQGDIEQCKRSFPKDVEFTEEIIEEIESSVGLLRAVSSLEQTRYYVREQKLVGDVVIEKTSKVGAKEFDGYRSIAADDGNEPTIKSSLHFTIDGIVWEIYYSDSAKAHVLLTYADANRDLARAMPTFLDYSEEIGPQDSDYPIGN